MTYRLQNLLLAMMLALSTLLLGLQNLSQNLTSGGYQLFEQADYGVAADNPLTTLENFAPSPKTASEYANAPNKTQLIDDLQANGTKSTPENVVDIRQTPDGRTIWLETGNSNAGLQHITERHASDFASRGVSQDQIPDLVLDAVQNGRVVGTTGSGRNVRSVYEVDFNGTTQRVAVGVGDNGFIVTAHPF